MRMGLSILFAEKENGIEQASCSINKRRNISRPCGSGCGSVETCRNAGGVCPCETAYGGGRAVGAVKYGNCSAEKHQEDLSV